MLMDETIHTQSGITLLVWSLAALKSKSYVPINMKFTMVSRYPVNVSKFGAIHRGKNYKKKILSIYDMCYSFIVKEVLTHFYLNAIIPKWVHNILAEKAAVHAIVLLKERNQFKVKIE